MKRFFIPFLFMLAAVQVQPAFAKEMEATIESTTVTAQKVEQNAQKVPISMTFLDDVDIEDNDIRTVSDIARYIPNFQQFSVGGAGMYTPTMRGMSADVHTLSSTIGTYVDGIPYVSSMGNDLVLEDIERIEILRGPQGTLYGRNAYAGVLNIITKKPGNEVRGKVEAQLGSDSKQQYSFQVSGPVLKDKLFIGLSGKHYQKDGYIKNDYLDKNHDDRKDNFIKIHLKSTPSKRLELSLISTYLKRDDDSTTVVPMASDDLKTVRGDMQGYTKSETHTHGFKVKYDMDSMSASSVTTYKNYKDKRNTDYDYSPAKMSHSKVDGEYDNFSQEFKINGNLNRVKWLTGLYMEKDDQKPYFTRNDATTTDNHTVHKSIGLFANLDYSITKRFILNAGLRYDNDRIETDDNMSDFEEEKDYGELSPKVGLQYIVNDNASTYITISKGYKSGGFYLMAPTDLRGYDEETLWNYEVGMKTKSLNNTLIFNLSAFYMDIDNMQVASYLTPFSAYISNAATATVKGAEAEVTYQAFKSLRLFGSFGYSETEFGEFSDSLGSYKGNENPFAPKYNYSLGAKYRDRRGIFAMADVSGQSSYYADKANKYKNDGYALANAKIGYETERFEIYLYCNNITDKEYNSEGYFNHYVMTSPPRETGVIAAYRF